jgi:hypothetical protein
MALITDAIDNKVATVSWLYDRMKVDGLSISKTNYIFNIGFKFNTTTASGRVTYTMSGKTKASLNMAMTDVFVFKATAATKLSDNTTDASVSYLWNDMLELYVKESDISTLYSANVTAATIQSIVWIASLGCTIRSKMSSGTNIAYISAFSVYSKSVIDPLYYINHSGVEAGQNYIGGAKTAMFKNSAGVEIPNDSKKGITNAELLGHPTNGTTKCVTENSVAQNIILDNIIYPVLGQGMFSSMNGTGTGTSLYYSSKNSTRTKIIPPWTYGIEVLVNPESHIYAHVAGFLYNNSSDLFTSLECIPYGNFTNTNLQGVGRAYFNDIHYQVKMPVNTTMGSLFTVPSTDDTIRGEGGDYQCWYAAGLSVSMSKLIINSENYVEFCDDFMRTPYLCPSILTGISTDKLYRHTVKYPTVSDIKELYYHPTLYNTKLYNAGYSLWAADANFTGVPIVIVPSGIYCSSPFGSSTTGGSTNLTFSLSGLRSKLEICNYAYSVDEVEPIDYTTIPANVFNILLASIKEATLTIKYYKNNGTTTSNTGDLSSYFTVTGTNSGGLSGVQFTLSGKNSISIGTDVNRIEFFLNGISRTSYSEVLDKFLLGFGHTYRRNDIRIQIGSIMVARMNI